MSSGHVGFVPFTQEVLLEPPAGLSIDDTEEIDRRAAAALSGEDPGVPWEELRKRLEG